MPGNDPRLTLRHRGRRAPGDVQQGTPNDHALHEDNAPERNPLDPSGNPVELPGCREQPSAGQQRPGQGHFDEQMERPSGCGRVRVVDFLGRRCRSRGEQSRLVVDHGVALPYYRLHVVQAVVALASPVRQRDVWLDLDRLEGLRSSAGRGALVGPAGRCPPRPRTVRSPRRCRTGCRRVQGLSQGRSVTGPGARVS